jgi:hypothetical protein
MNRGRSNRDELEAKLGALAHGKLVKVVARWLSQLPGPARPALVRELDSRRQGIALPEREKLLEAALAAASGFDAEARDAAVAIVDELAAEPDPA